MKTTTLNKEIKTQSRSKSLEKTRKYLESLIYKVKPNHSQTHSDNLQGRHSSSWPASARANFTRTPNNFEDWLKMGSFQFETDHIENDLRLQTRKQKDKKGKNCFRFLRKQKAFCINGLMVRKITPSKRPNLSLTLLKREEMTLSTINDRIIWAAESISASPKVPSIKVRRHSYVGRDEISKQIQRPASIQIPRSTRGQLSAPICPWDVVITPFRPEA